jgi:hypothetical protein
MQLPTQKPIPPIPPKPSAFSTLLGIPEPLLSPFHELFPFRLQLHQSQRQVDDEEQGKLYPEMIVQMVIIAIAIMIEPVEVRIQKMMRESMEVPQRKILNI